MNHISPMKGQEERSPMPTDSRWSLQFPIGIPSLRLLPLPNRCQKPPVRSHRAAMIIVVKMSSIRKLLRRRLSSPYPNSGCRGYRWQCREIWSRLNGKKKNCNTIVELRPDMKKTTRKVGNIAANTYGYVRVSTKDQNEDRQLIAMHEINIPKKSIFIDKQSGKDFERPQYRKLMRK